MSGDYKALGEQLQPPKKQQRSSSAPIISPPPLLNSLSDNPTSPQRAHLNARDVSLLLATEYIIRKEKEENQRKRDFLLIEQNFFEVLLKPTLSKILEKIDSATDNFLRLIQEGIRAEIPNWQEQLDPDKGFLTGIFDYNYRDKQEAKKNITSNKASYHAVGKRLISQAITHYVSDEKSFKETAPILTTIAAKRAEINKLLIQSFFFTDLVTEKDLDNLKKGETEAFKIAIMSKIDRFWPNHGRNTEEKKQGAERNSKAISISGCDLEPADQRQKVIAYLDEYLRTSTEFLQSTTLKQENASLQKQRSQLNTEINQLRSQATALNKIQEAINAILDRQHELRETSIPLEQAHAACLQRLRGKKLIDTEEELIQTRKANTIQDTEIRAKRQEFIQLGALLTGVEKKAEHRPQSKPVPTSKAEESFLSKHRYKILCGLSLLLSIINTILILTGVLAPIGITLEGFNQVWAGAFSTAAINLTISYIVSIVAPLISYAFGKLISTIVSCCCGSSQTEPPAQMDPPYPPGRSASFSSLTERLSICETPRPSVSDGKEGSRPPQEQTPSTSSVLDASPFSPITIPPCSPLRAQSSSSIPATETLPPPPERDTTSSSASYVRLGD